ncbi:MAG: 2-amino-4-hydroxy-6-hydroxymethyldihydropteridine diphosphokinase [Paludibacteraceae bacterium]
MAFVFLGLGTNLGDKEFNLNRAIQQIGFEIGSVLNISSFYESKAWGFQSDNEFLNAVILVESKLSAPEILEKAKKIEQKMGRILKSDVSYHDRTIDIDILLYDNQIVELPNLKIPHPLLHKRDFVLIPLMEIAPDLVHPLLNETITSFNNKLQNNKEKKD